MLPSPNDPLPVYNNETRTYDYGRAGTAQGLAYPERAYGGDQAHSAPPPAYTAVNRTK